VSIDPIQVVESAIDFDLNKDIVFVAIESIEVAEPLIYFELNQADDILKFDLTIVLYMLIKNDLIENKVYNGDNNHDDMIYQNYIIFSIIIHFDLVDKITD
jgi:hypothetical protein